MKQLFPLVTLLTIAAMVACGQPERKEFTQQGSHPSGSDTTALATLPDGVRYPGAAVVAANPFASDRITGASCLFETPDTLATVTAYYERCFEEKLSSEWTEVGSSSSSHMKEFCGSDDETGNGCSCMLVAQDDGTVILLTCWQRR